MDSRSQVIGWLCVDASNPHVLVRDEHGLVSSQTTDADSSFEQFAIQTGCFGRGNPIIDPETHEILGYEIESVA